ncbi:type 1 glutamine amidotransferase domain-containing protein [Lentilactobacillus sp. G22-6]|uniref:type 1 glutamine amidotransferase domain-containing protein n=1 Tax=Lentilactobacillus dabitei TaxID=2831523 RepID=UPI001C262806|nr:type 1 glutamine amidotransferase domain-containing protein [Lentilactobacillus dabitei]MBU9789464.1 type 1 glutamine amidotransferase domain-containing protein [Lentilactobacillus dabitei]
MKKILVVLTNINHYHGTDDPTGLWLGEAAEFVAVMQTAGIQVDYVSPKGGFVPLDPRSMKYTNQEIMKVYETDDFQRRALSNSLNPDQVNAADYTAIYYTGDHGVMWDFPDNPELQRIALTIYQNNGFVTSVCHGVAGLLNIKDSNGDYLITNKTITGFTAAEEAIAAKRSVVPFLNKPEVEKHGGHWRQKRFYSEFAVQDGQLITGQNPFSATAVATRLIQNLQVNQ